MPFKVVVEELRTEAAGSTDLLAHAAGNLVGLYLARPTATQPRAVAAFAALVLAGADPQALVGRADESRERMTTAPWPP